MGLGHGKRRIEFEGGSIWVAPPEYVILRKLEYYREADRKNTSAISPGYSRCPGPRRFEETGEIGNRLAIGIRVARSPEVHREVTPTSAFCPRALHPASAD